MYWMVLIFDAALKHCSAAIDRRSRISAVTACPLNHAREPFLIGTAGDAYAGEDMLDRPRIERVLQKLA
jgi:hypothetical protein